MKAVIIDDEPLARDLTRVYLKAFPQIEVAEECGDGFEGLKDIQQHQPDLIFLDIQMPKINGFEMLELVEQPPAVIFTTAFDEYAMKAFEAHAIDYLLKPFSRERFDKAIQKWKSLGQKSASEAVSKLMSSEAETQPAQSNRIVVKDNTRIKIISL